MTNVEQCLFCAKFGSDAVEREWYDQELYATDSFVVTPGLGPLDEGYLLIISRGHHVATSSLSEGEIGELDALKDEVRRVVGERIGRSLVFEHGPPQDGSGGGSCIDHLHLHVQVTDADLLSPLRDRHSVRSIRFLRDLRAYRDRSYLFLQDQDGAMHVSEAHDARGQYMRRLLSEASGRPDTWDYATFPNYGLIESTITKLTPWPLARNG